MESKEWTVLIPLLLSESLNKIKTFVTVNVFRDLVTDLIHSMCYTYLKRKRKFPDDLGQVRDSHTPTVSLTWVFHSSSTTSFETPVELTDVNLDVTEIRP